MDLGALKPLGMTESEIEVYISLIRRGPMTVSQISEESGVHRTNIYTILNKLENMGLVSHSHEGNRKKYKTTNPENLLNYLNETKSKVESIIPDLSRMRKDVNETVSVYFFKGVSGMKSALRDLVRDNKDIFAIGLAGHVRKTMPNFQKQIMRDIRKSGVKIKGIYIDSIKPAEFGKFFEVRFLPKEFLSPVYTWIYGDKVVFNIWEPSITAIMIKSSHVANEYKKYFNLLWKIAKAK